MNMQFAVLPIMHSLLFVFAAFLDHWSPYGLSPVFCADLPVSLPLVARDDLATVLMVGLLGTAWWYFIGRIGSLSRTQKISRLGSVGGTLVVFLTCGIGTYALVSQITTLTHDPRLTVLVVVDYLLGGLLLVGGWISGINAAVSVLNSRSEGPTTSH